VFYKLSEGLSSLLIPFFVKDILKGELGTVGVVLSLTSIAAVPASIFWGTLSDRLHKRKALIILGFAGSGISFLLMSLAQNTFQFGVLSFFFGLSSAALAPVSAILVMETSRREDWSESFGIFNKVGGWGWVGGLVLGVMLVPLLSHIFTKDLSMRLAFALMGILSLLAAYLAKVWLPEPKSREDRMEYVKVVGRYPGFEVIEKVMYLPRRLVFFLNPSRLGNLGETLSRELKWYLLATFLIFSGVLMSYTVFPLYLRDQIGIPEYWVYIINIVRTSSSSFFYAYVGVWIKRAERGKLQIIGTACRSAIFLFYGLLSFIELGFLKIPLIILVDAFSGFFWALIVVSGSTIVASLSKKGLEGEALGVYNTVIGFSKIFGTLVSGYLTQWLGFFPNYAMASLLITLGAIITLKINLQG
jgi:MFS family permease